MEIPYGVLPYSEAGWLNGLEWLKELERWSRSYEEGHMIPTASNKRLAAWTIERILWNLPSRMKGIGKNVVATLLEDKLRAAML